MGNQERTHSYCLCFMIAVMLAISYSLAVIINTFLSVALKKLPCIHTKTGCERPSWEPKTELVW